MAYVYLGNATGVSASSVWESSGDDVPGAVFGRSVASAGDVNGDGFSDIVVGASQWGPSGSSPGKTYVYLGSPGGPSSTPGWTAVGEEAWAEFGYSVAPMGDVNGDGFSDIAIGSPGYWTPTGGPQSGKVYLYLGDPGGLSAGPAWSAVGDGLSTARFGGFGGGALSSAGDVDNNGSTEIIIGAPLFDTPTWQAGKAYVYTLCP